MNFDRIDKILIFDILILIFEFKDIEYVSIIWRFKIKEYFFW